MKKICISFIAAMLSATGFATHNYSGEIQYKRVAPFGSALSPIYTYSITVIRYTDHGPSIAERCADTVYFGDGLKGIAPRINGGTSLNCSCPGTVACGEIILQQSGYIVKKNIYSILHTYSGAGSYLIKSSDPNRSPGIHNIPGSSSLPFILEARLNITAGTGTSSSPVFGTDPINHATLSLCYTDGLAMSDADGDSLSYELIPCAAPGYFYPETGGGSISMNQSGTLTWCVPQLLAEYQVAYKVSEWRKNGSGVYVLIGYVIRDRHILVKQGIVGLNERGEADAVFVYPNPVSTQLIVRYEGEVSADFIIELYDVQGKKLERNPERSGKTQCMVPMEDLSAGLYLLKIWDGPTVKSYKIVKE